MRLNRFLALCGLGSRRQVETLILNGEVNINGVEVRELSTRVMGNERIFVSGTLCRPPLKFTYLVFHKPKGCLCTRTDPEGRKTVYEILPHKYGNLKYCGRLDYNTSGLLLFSDDGESIRKLLLPTSKIQRHYRVRLNTPISDVDLRQLKKGIVIESFQYRPMHLVAKKPELILSLTEGKNREVRKIFEYLNYQVSGLHRLSYGSIDLGKLKRGEYRELTPRELKTLLAELP